MRKSIVAVVAASLAAFTAVGVTTAAAAHHKKKTYTIKYTTVKGPLPTDLSHLTGKLTGTPFGPATFTGKVVVPITTYTWTFTGKYAGTLHIKYTSKLTGVDASGPWTVTSGTGKFKGATGTGTATGAIDGSKPFVYKGTVKF